VYIRYARLEQHLVKFLEKRKMRNAFVYQFVHLQILQILEILFVVTVAQ
jgi:hypothetical protein